MAGGILRVCSGEGGGVSSGRIGRHTTMEEPPRPLRIAPRPPVRVIGMPAEVVAMCFAEADSDRNGVIDGTYS